MTDTIVAVSTGPLWRLPLGEALAAVRAAGAEAVEVMVTQDPATQDAAEIERLAARLRVEVVAVHAPLLVLTRRVFTTDPIVKVRRTLDLAERVGARTVVVHPPYPWQVRYTRWVTNGMQDASERSLASITMENMYPVAVARRQVGLQRFQSLRGLGRFPEVTLDTSHLAVAGMDLLDSYQRLRSRVVHLHLSDNRGRGRDSHAAPGTGVLPLAELVHALDPSRVRSIALEVNPGPAAEDRSRLEALLGSSLAFVRDNMPGRIRQR